MVLPLIKNSFWGSIIHRASGRRLLQTKIDGDDDVVKEKYMASVSSSDSFEKPYIVVDWDGDEDKENPKNWNYFTKLIVIVQVCFLTWTSVMASSLYSPSIEIMKAEFKISHTVAELPLALYVIGFAVGPMVLGPLSESPKIGRVPIYIISHFMYIIFQIPQSWGRGTHSFATIAVLRFLTGVLASPVLAVGSATCGDVMVLDYLPMAIVAWSASSIAGPCIGPLIGSALTDASKSWEWCFRFQLLVGIGSFLFCSFLLPETYAPAILHRRAERLRILTGNYALVTQYDLEHPTKSASQTIKDLLWRPVELTVSEPMVLMINIYTSLLYAIMFLWFTAFPIVFERLYQFTLVELGTAYLGVLFGVFLGAGIFMVVVYHLYTKKLLRGFKTKPEVFMPAAIYGSLWIPTGLFIFGWTAKASVHWISPIIGSFVFAHGTFIIFQTLFNYLATSYPHYVASVFASNSLARSLLAGVSPLFGTFLFDNLSTSHYPVAWGSSLLGFLTVVMIGIPIVFYIYGPRLRGKSKYTKKIILCHMRR